MSNSIETEHFLKLAGGLPVDCAVELEYVSARYDSAFWIRENKCCGVVRRVVESGAEAPHSKEKCKTRA